MLKILIVDDHEIVRLGLKSLLSRHEEWDVVGEADTIEKALRLTELQQPDVVIMDIHFQEGNGIEACRKIRAQRPVTKVIMLTAYAEDDLLFGAIEAEASAYVLKQVGNEELLRAITAVSRGEALLDPSVTGRVLERLRSANHTEAFSALNAHELQVLGLLAKGKTNKQIAKNLHLSAGTTRNYVSSILHKLGVSNRAEASAYAVRHNLDRYLQRSTDE